MQRTIERLRRKIGKTQRIMVIGVLIFGILLGLFSILLSLNVVTITDSNGETHTLVTANRQPEEILELAGVETDHNDEVVYTRTGMGGVSISINRSFPVNIVVDGKILVAELADGTVADALAACNVVLGQHDFANPSLDAEVYRDMQVEVNRVEYVEETLRTEVSAEEVEAYKQNVLGEEAAAGFVHSKSRIYDATMVHRMVNGVIESSEAKELQAVIHPYDEPSASFQPGVPVSTIDRFLGVEIDETGAPTNYVRKIENAICTSYSASGGRGAGGQGLYCGTVAVNPNVIPYGTRLYIASADRSFVYGYAIASDCGIAMMDGRVDFDLYFESNAECYRFGKRTLEVYVLD
jgi:3D (Asp-Asp-Asp) domain-containing protein